MFKNACFSFSNTVLQILNVRISGVLAGGQSPPPSDNFLGALTSKGGAKIHNYRCEILYKTCKVQLVNRFKDSSDSGISIAIQVKNSFWE